MDGDSGGDISGTVTGGTDMGRTGMGDVSGNGGSENGRVDGSHEDPGAAALESMGYTVDGGTGPDRSGGDTDSGTSDLVLILYGIVFLIALVLLASTFL